MSLTVCLAPRSTLGYPEGGGHLWASLNWARGLHALGCRVIWLEREDPGRSAEEVQTSVAELKRRLEPYGLAQHLAVESNTSEPLARDAASGCLGFEAAAEADLLLSQDLNMPPEVVARFRRSAFLDIDPGLLQTWVASRRIGLARHDVYFTIGETVGRPGALFPDLGIECQYTPPCIALDWWPARRAPADAPFTTVAHWFAGSWTEDAGGPGDKRSGFLPYLDLPCRTPQPLELALDLPRDHEDCALLGQYGWRVRDALTVASTPWEYQRYIRASFGEFSCAKPAYVRLQTAWVSDRTLCYLASGKPAVVQHTGPSRFLPDAAGLFRFRDFDEAVRSIETVVADYDRQCRLARVLAEEHFDAGRVVRRLLERAVG